MNSPVYAPKRRRVGMWIAISLLGVLVLAGVAVIAFALGAKHQRATAVRSFTTSQSATDQTKQICDLNDMIIDVTGQGDLVRQIADLARNSSGAETGVRIDATTLGATYDLAMHAKGGQNEVSTALNAVAAHIELGTACIKAGWKSGH